MRHDPNEIIHVFETGKYPYSSKMRRTVYEKRKAKLQAELLKAQKWIQDNGERVVMLFEGRDAAGKGGTIKRFMEHLNPRGANVVALQKPTEREKSQWYFQRYIQHLPSAGENRYVRPVLVQPGRCRTRDGDSAARMNIWNSCGNALIWNACWCVTGVRLFKYWFSVTQDEQRRRFDSRKTDPLKHWKLSPIDMASLDKWADYTEAKRRCSFTLDTADAPWTVVSRMTKSGRG